MFYRLRSGLSVLVFTLVLSACASNKPAMQTEFKTRITESGLKHFQLGFKKKHPPAEAGNMPANRNQQRARRDGGGPPPRRRDSKRSEKALLKTLEEQIAANQFCREGYWILDKNFMGRDTYIRGECNETATAQDRSNFPDTIHNW